MLAPLHRAMAVYMGCPVPSAQRRDRVLPGKPNPPAPFPTGKGERESPLGDSPVLFPSPERGIGADTESATKLTRQARAAMLAALPKWRNGRRDGLKNRCPQGHEGSSPSFGTIYQC